MKTQSRKSPKSTFGWAGTILRVDLSSGTISKEPLSKALMTSFIGGRGINSKMLYDEVTPGIEPLSPENRIIFGAGPLTGTLVPSSSRLTITSKSPLTGILGDSNVGGRFGPELKFAGYDHIIIKGKSDKPVYIWIDDDDVELRDATHLWGNDTLETVRTIHKELSNSRIQIIAIGPAGENLVKFACIMHQGMDAAGRTGLGAVMGSKHLKAIAVRGTKGIKIAEPTALIKMVEKLQKKLVEDPLLQPFSTYGTPSLAAMDNQTGILVVKNYQQSGEYEKIGSILPETLAKQFITGANACFSCPIHCGHSYEIKDGPYAGERSGKVEYGCIGSCGPACGNTYVPSIIKINNLANQYGIDVLEYGILMSIAMEWYEKGIISSEETEGIQLNWGNYEAMIEMLHKIVKREGFGNILAEGPLRSAKAIGRGAEKYVSHCKGLTFSLNDIRAMKGTALSHAVSTRGADHLRGSVYIELAGEALMSPKEAEARFGNTEVLNTTSYDKSIPTAYYQDICTLADALGICKFATEYTMTGMDLKDMSRFYSAATGIPMDEKGVREIAERIYTLERAFLVREGITRKDDMLMGKWGRERIASGPLKGEGIDHEKFNKLLDNWYTLRGWDKKSGIPTGSKLEALGLDDVASELEAMGKVK